MDPRFSEKNNPLIIRWLLTVSVLIIIMIVLGGYVRLTRSGLSIVEWNPISGVIPPIGEAAWQTEFAKYQQSPEYLKINQGMTMDGYKRIFWAEWIHRFIGRIAGLIVVLPLFYFIIKGIIPWRKSALYVALAAGFGLQGYIGWIMVASGLVDRPSVSHFRLTLHLVTALSLLGLTVWTAMKHIYQRPSKIPNYRSSSPYRYAMMMLGLLMIQISYGGFVAGLDAGWISNTWPLMSGRLIPRGLFLTFESWLLNIVSAPLTVHFIHRWFAFIILFAAIAIYMIGKRRGYHPALFKGIAIFLVLVGVQITLGVLTVWLGVPIFIALAHQFTAILLFMANMFMLYHVVYRAELAVVTQKRMNPLPQAGD